MASSTTFPPEIVRIRGDSRQSFIINVGKKVLKEQGVVEYHAVGAACGLAVIGAERLAKFGYATINSIETSQIEGNRSKIIVKLTKTADFERLEKEFADSREARPTNQ
jgi:hypothetical protein